MDVLENLGCVPTRVVASEGGARSSIWRQIAADVLNLPITYLSPDPGAALSAAFTAGMGIGAFGHWEDIEKFISIQDLTKPRESESVFYSKVFELYKRIYKDLKEDFRRIPRWEEG